MDLNTPLKAAKATVAALEDLMPGQEATSSPAPSKKIKINKKTGKPVDPVMSERSRKAALKRKRNENCTMSKKVVPRGVCPTCGRGEPEPEPEPEPEVDPEDEIPLTQLLAATSNV